MFILGPGDGGPGRARRVREECAKSAGRDGPRGRCSPAQNSGEGYFPYARRPWRRR